MPHNPYHQFHIPVMGLAYTIDSPIKVARFGISSAISIVEDRLIETMRAYYYKNTGREYRPISTTETDYRAKRITDYLNLVHQIVQDQVKELRRAAFEKGADITRYFEMLPDDHGLKKVYRQMLQTVNPVEKKPLEEYLRDSIKPGRIDVNIMTKTDRDTYRKGEKVVDGSDAVAALRGYANSVLSDSAVIFSAGMNPRLFNYLGSCPEFQWKSISGPEKKVIVKVSDYRSAVIQGKYLAKKGIWVSEFRIESGLNCGGHAFATEGYLLGPILEEFKQNKQQLTEELFDIFKEYYRKGNGYIPVKAPVLKISVQGGIGTYEEARLLHDHYDISSTGWGTPFLLVPEATTVDDETLQKLAGAGNEDIVLSHSSPLGARFYYLKGTSSEQLRLSRIRKGRPGSPCTEKHLAFNTEFTKEPICTASHEYQELKLAQLKEMAMPEKEYRREVEKVTSKECLCVGLSNAASILYQQPFLKRRTEVTVCPGPNIVHFSRIVSLQSMVNHIYGRENLMSNPDRPHMFIAELNLYLDFLKEQLEQENARDMDVKKKKYFESFMLHLRKGICYYRNLKELAPKNREACDRYLEYAELELDGLSYQYSLIQPECCNKL